MTTPSVASPRTELRNLIVEVQNQKISEGSFSVQLIGKITKISEREIREPNSFSSDYISVRNEILNSLDVRERALNSQISLLITDYLGRNGDVAMLAEAIFGQSSSSDKQAFIDKAMRGQVVIIKELHQTN